MARELARTGPAKPGVLDLYHDDISERRSIPPALAGAAQLKATANSSCWCEVNVFN